MFQKVFGLLKAFGKAGANCLFNNACAGKANNGVRFRKGNVTQHCEGRCNAACCRVGQNDNVGKPFFLQLADGHCGTSHLHQRQDAFLHACAARSRNHNQRGVLKDRQFDGGDNAFADGGSH